MTLQSREQLILQKIAKPIDKANALESRAEALPAMLLRHGVLPVKLFLLSKSDEDKRLWRLVEEGIQAVLKEVDISVEGLSKMPFEQILLVNEVAVEVSTLVARWIKVHTAGTP